MPLFARCLATAIAFTVPTNRLDFMLLNFTLAGLWVLAPVAPKPFSFFNIFVLQYQALSMNLMLFALFCCSHAMELNLYLLPEAAGHIQLHTAPTLHAHTVATKIKLSILLI